jgi:hypothetical protein
MNKWGPEMEKFKSWAFPGLAMVLATIIWQDVREIKSDIKALMAQSNIDKTRIDNLERKVFDLHEQTGLPIPPAKDPIDNHPFTAFVLTRNENLIKKQPKPKFHTTL